MIQMTGTVIRKRLWWSVIKYHISQTETKMKQPERCILRNTSEPVVKILKKNYVKKFIF